jgi:Ca2+-binding RTX toxin-like protein
MSVFLPVTNLITTDADDHAIDLDGDDQLFVLPSVTIAALGAGASAVFSASSGSNDVDIQGTLISATSYALDLGGRNNHVFVATGGTVSGRTGGLAFSDGGNSVANLGAVTVKRDGWGIETGDNSRIVNEGVVDALAGGGINAAGGGNYILNDGDITARFEGVRVANGSNRVINNGDIISIGDIGSSYGVVIASDAGQEDRLFNSGLISATDAAVLGGNGAELVTNTGTIDGDLLMGGGNDVIANRGEITGDVFLGAGADRFVGSRGAGSGTIDAGGGDDVVFGWAEADVVLGQAGDDVLWGNGGEDSLNGGSDNDRLLAGTGDDTLEGGAGSDRLDGGDGKNTFVFQAGAERDLVFGFKHGDDKIAVEVAGVDDFQDLIIRANAVGDALVLWADGSGRAGFTLVGVSASSLTEADFVF